MNRDQLVTGLHALADRGSSTIGARSVVDAAQRAATARRRRRARWASGTAVTVVAALLVAAALAVGRGGSDGQDVASGDQTTSDRPTTSMTPTTVGREAETTAPAPASPPLGPDEIVVTTGTSLSGPRATGGSVVVLSATGREPRPVDGIEGLVSAAAVDPSGTRIVYSSNGGRTFVYNLVDGSTTELTALDGASTPTWDPSGQHVAAIRGGRVIILAPSRQEGRTLPIEQALLASWSPDGTELAVAHGDPVSVTIISVDGATQRPFAPVAGEVAGPSWSPDGSTIAFTDGETNTIHLASPDGGDVRQLTTCEDPCTEDLVPTWSSDGQQIAFARNFGGRRQVFMVSVRDGATFPLTNDDQDYVFPDWR